VKKHHPTYELPSYIVWERGSIKLEVTMEGCKLTCKHDDGGNGFKKWQELDRGWGTWTKDENLTSESLTFGCL
jgi:hypothetical protein